MLFCFRSRLKIRSIHDRLRTFEDDLGAPPRDRLDMICVLDHGVVVGSSVFYALTSGQGQMLTADAPPLTQERVAMETDTALLLFYTLLLDSIVGRQEVRPQLLSYLPPDHGMGLVVAVS
jgi:hypothetical protein